MTGNIRDKVFSEIYGLSTASGIPQRLVEEEFAKIRTSIIRYESSVGHRRNDNWYDNQALARLKGQFSSQRTYQ